MVEGGAGWNIDELVARFGSHVSPELLVIVLVDALARLEAGHRAGLIHGALRPSCLRVAPDGVVSITGWGEAVPEGERQWIAPEVQRGARPTMSTDVRELLKLVASRMPDGLRIHPDLKRLLRDLIARKHVGAWEPRAALLDFLAAMGVEGAPFFVERFVRDPAEYTRALTVVLAEREYRQIRYLNAHGRRRKAVAELHFLLEITPVNRQALNLWRAVKQGRRRALARASYALAVGLAIFATASVIVEKLQLPLPQLFYADHERPKALVIEPVEPQREVASTGPGARAYEPGGAIEVTARLRDVTPARGTQRGSVALELDDDASVYFDGSPGTVPAHRDREVVWLRPGTHTVTVTKPGYPPTVASIVVKRDRQIELAGRALAH